MRPRGTVVELERRREHAVKLIDEGVPRKWIAKVLGVSLGALSHWKHLAASGALKSKPCSGRPCRLTDNDCQRLELLLLEGATAYGWDNNLWTCARVSQIIKIFFGVTYHPDHVSRILKTRLNWTCQRPAHEHNQRDDAEIAWWVSKRFPQIVTDAAARNAYLAFIDESGFMLTPTVRRTYSPRGKTPIDRVADKHGRISVIGAIVVSPGRHSVSLKYALSTNNTNFRGPSVVQFLRTLRSTMKAPLTIVWDKIPIHECDCVERFPETHKDVTLEYFPPYAPELNPADGIWRYTKYNRLANYCAPNLSTLRSTVVTELDRLAGIPDLLKSFVRFTKLPIDL